MKTIAIDPGIRNMGIACFHGRLLCSAALIRGEQNTKVKGVALIAPMLSALQSWKCARLATDRIVVEIPRVYPAAQQKGDQNDLISLAVMAGAIVSMLAVPGTEILQYFPHEWKGTGDADVCTRRILQELERANETQYLGDCPQSLAHNMIDAVGIGLKSLGRFEPRKVYPL